MDSLLLSLVEPLSPFIAAWTLLYLLARFVLFRQRSADFANRVVSVVHALAAILLAVPALDWSSPLGRVGQANTAAQVCDCLTDPSRQRRLRCRPRHGA
jgi:hypothetical protein